MTMLHTMVTSASPGRSPLSGLCQPTMQRVTGHSPGGDLYSGQEAEAAVLQLQGNRPASSHPARDANPAPRGLRVRSQPGTSAVITASPRTRGAVPGGTQRHATVSC